VLRIAGTSEVLVAIAWEGVHFGGVRPWLLGARESLSPLEKIRVNWAHLDP